MPSDLICWCSEANSSGCEETDKYHMKYARGETSSLFRSFQNLGKMRP